MDSALQVGYYIVLDTEGMRESHFVNYDSLYLLIKNLFTFYVYLKLFLFPLRLYFFLISYEI